MHWPELVRLVLLGTDRSATDIEGRPEDQILELLARTALQSKAGWEPLQWNGALPEPAPETTEIVCPPKAAQFLDILLDKGYAALLPEYLQALQKHNWILPPERIPELLNRCQAQPGLWEQLAPGLGLTGQWIAAQHPAWNQWHITVDDLHWEQATHEQHCRYLKHLHQLDPVGAVSTIEAVWQESPLRYRVDFLKTLSPPGHPAVYNLLESLLQDKRKEIRQTASGLLRQAKGSPLQQRLFDHLLQWISWHPQGPEIKMALPSTLPATFEKDGFTISDTNLFLRQAIAAIPPDWWADAWEAEPFSVLAAFGKHSDELADALLEAVLNNPAGIWIEAMGAYWMDHASSFSPEKIKMLIPLLPSAFVTDQCSKSLLNREIPLAEDHPVAQLIRESNHPWDKRLSLIFVRHLQRWMQQSSQFKWNTWHYQQLMRSAALRADPSIVREIQEGWPTDTGSWYQWKGEVELLLSLLAFRKQMLDALTPKGS